MADRFLLCGSIAAFLCSIGAAAKSTIDLGSCTSFAVFASSAVNFDGELTILKKGSVGISPGYAVTGDYVVDNGSVEISTPLTTECVKVLKIAVAIASTATCPTSNILNDLAGLTLTPGVYCFSSGAINFSGSTLTLDGGGDINAQWIFQSASTLTTATATSVILQNGASAENVFWSVGSSATIGYSSQFVGTVLAKASITAGSTSSVEGRLLSLAAVTFSSGSTVTLPSASTSSSRFLRSAGRSVGRSLGSTPRFTIMTADIPLGACAQFSVQAGTAVTFDGNKTTITSGSVGVSPGSSIGGSFQLKNGSVEISSTSSGSCAGDRITAYNAAAGASCPANQTVSELSGLTLGPGVYCANDMLTISATSLTLDARGDADAQWIFQAGSSLITSPYTSVILINGAQAKNVYWKVGSSCTLGYSSSFVGTIIAYASITFNHDTSLVGRGLAGAAVSFASSSVIELPL